MSEYAELGKKYGIALSEVAKSVGTTVNDLAKTPVGVFMLVLVAYKVVGSDFIGIAKEIVWFAVMLPMWAYYFKKLILSTERTTTVEKDGKTIVNSKPVDFSDSYVGGPAVLMLFIFIIVCIVGLVL